MRARHRARHLESRHLSEASLAQLELDLLEQVVGLVRHVEVGVAGDAEDGALDDVHPWEERGQEVREHLLERHEPAGVADGDEPRQPFGHFHAREPLLARLRVAGEHRETDRERRDVGERLPGADGEWRENRIDVELVPALELLELVRREVFDPGDDDALGGERGAELLRPDPGLRRIEAEHDVPRLGECLLRRSAVRRADVPRLPRPARSGRRRAP